MTRLPEEVEEAVIILKEAEMQTDEKIKIRSFEEGFEILDQYLNENSEINDDLKVKTRNIKKSYTRALLSQLPNIIEVDMATWFDYIKVMTFLVKEEIGEIERESPRHKEYSDSFINIYRKELIESISRSCR